MKKTILISMISVMILTNCSTPYKSLKGFKSFDEIEYIHSVKKTTLPNGVSLAYMEAGNGSKTIILIHGLGSYSQAWNMNFDELAKKYRTIAIDLPGYGKSSKKAHDGSMTYYAETVSQLINKLNLKNVYVAGHSMGGQIAITTALLYPESIKGLILVAPAGFETFTKGQKEWFRNAMPKDLIKYTSAEAIQNNLASNFYKFPKNAEFMITDRLRMREAEDFDAYAYAVSQSVKGMVNYPVVGYLQNIEVPTLIFFGENDQLIPNRFLNPGTTEKIAKSGATKIKNCKLIMVPKTGHFMMFEKAEVFNQETIKFLDAIGKK